LGGTCVGGKLPGCSLKRPPKPPKAKFKTNTFVDTTIAKLYVIYPSGEITLRTPLMTGILEF
jgi:hypothetical protein